MTTIFIYVYVRQVCKHFNQTCQKLLNRGFSLIEKYHALCLRSVKTQLPRRESERRNHPLARHCDALTAIETRISMLSMTFIKYINMQLCCFIPGKVSIAEISKKKKTLGIYLNTLERRIGVNVPYLV